jgi:uncharacterized protein VirK/YbjX
MALAPATILQVARATFPDPGLSSAVLRLRILAGALRHRGAIRPFLSPSRDSELARLMAAQPDTLGALIWPYQCAAWGPEERLARILSHCAEVDRLGAPFTFPHDCKLPLVDLSDRYPGLSAVLDKPRWFMREGGLVVNLFVAEFRAFSLAFSFHRQDGGPLTAFIGGLQGRNRDGVLDLYRSLTGALHDLRPRDLLIEIFRMICRATGVTGIQAVAQAQRHHRHPYFGRLSRAPLPLDYDAIWSDRDGTRLDERAFRLAVDPPRRDLETVKPNKRSLYRKRFGLLDEIDARLQQDLPGLRPITFTDT